MHIWGYFSIICAYKAYFDPLICNIFSTYNSGLYKEKLNLLLNFIWFSEYYSSINL